MEVTLHPKLEKFIEAKIASGKYQSLEEVINAGLELLMEQDHYSERLEKLRQEIKVGVEASERGEVIEGEVVFERIQKKLEQHRTH